MIYEINGSLPEWWTELQKRPIKTEYIIKHWISQNWCLSDWNSVFETTFLRHFTIAPPKHLGQVGATVTRYLPQNTEPSSFWMTSDLRQVVRCLANSVNNIQRSQRRVKLNNRYSWLQKIFHFSFLHSTTTKNPNITSPKPWSFTACSIGASCYRMSAHPGECEEKRWLG